ncbi:hypothetical protein K2173_014912 [Erythroxylum novogranatense]|uniref:Uncharacterized protein n=1 Tax=Erythroxylum novogranatense TaxID=1862640 RepID=A0AAV8TG33_9ROSI|nr:hypothetical protein K2173_014912 [Erythroxylum novogranatense]
MASNIHKTSSGALNQNDALMGAFLMQNCDLPPPAKVFSGSDKVVVSSMNRVFGMTARDGSNDDENEKLELLKALRLSQTRAREAERQAEELAVEKDYVSNALLKESLQLLVYRQWVRVLEFQVLKLQSQKERQEKEFCFGCGRPKAVEEMLKEGKDSEDGGWTPWFGTLAFCFGILGVGLALGCRYLF